MLAAHQSSELQVSCESRTTPACKACFLAATWIAPAAPKPRQVRLFCTSTLTDEPQQSTGRGNKLGQYYCWNRLYDINTGRWTTPDPVASPWWNLFDYTISRPTQTVDTTGLSPSLAAKLVGCLAAAALAVAADWVFGMAFPNSGSATCKSACKAAIVVAAMCVTLALVTEPVAASIGAAGPEAMLAYLLGVVTLEAVVGLSAAVLSELICEKLCADPGAITVPSPEDTQKKLQEARAVDERGEWDSYRPGTKWCKHV